ncbi:ribonuclease 3-like isoform X2 [Dreissena polymorpha]|uniref:ribonuclease 3-like isoform X2 n=1 Tax=Dreissena polymorpha TaxID=45954 RepID=UPI002263ADA9|nr:ribonuclease 3-like isoform X2 [Dreissena polymorpha]
MDDRSTSGSFHDNFSPGSPDMTAMEAIDSVMGDSDVEGFSESSRHRHSHRSSVHSGEGLENRSRKHRHREGHDHHHRHKRGHRSHRSSSSYGNHSNQEGDQEGVPAGYIAVDQEGEVDSMPQVYKRYHDLLHRHIDLEDGEVHSPNEVEEGEFLEPKERLRKSSKHSRSHSRKHKRKHSKEHSDLDEFELDYVDKYRIMETQHELSRESLRRQREMEIYKYEKAKMKEALKERAYYEYERAKLEAAMKEKAMRRAIREKAYRDAVKEQAYKDALKKKAYMDDMEEKAMRDAMKERAYRKALKEKAYQESMREREIFGKSGSSIEYGASGAVLMDDSDTFSVMSDYSMKSDRRERALSDQGRRVQRGLSGAILVEERSPERTLSYRDVYPEEFDGARVKVGRSGAILKDDIEERGFGSMSGERIVRGRSGAVLREDTADEGGKIVRGRSGAILMEDNDEHGDFIAKRSDARLGIGRTGSVLREEMPGAKIARGASGAILLEDREDEKGWVEMGKTGAILRDDRSDLTDAPAPRYMEERQHPFKKFPPRGNMPPGEPSWGSAPMGTRGRGSFRGQGRGRGRGQGELRSPMPVHAPDADDASRSSRIGSNFYRWNDGAVQNKTSDVRVGRERTPEKIDAFAPQKPKWKPKEEDVRLQQCVRAGSAVSEESSEGTGVTAWVRCSAADLYFIRDRQTCNMMTTQRMRDLETTFNDDLVQRARKVKATQEPYKMERQTRPSWKNVNKCAKGLCGHAVCQNNNANNSEGSDSDISSSSSSDSDDAEEGPNKELQFKINHPYRMHKEIWYNEPKELNDGPLCRCSLKARRFGIRHDIYPGEEPIPRCDVNSNNLDRLHHYKITISPTTNFVSNHPTVIMFDGHEYKFEGFSIFAHEKLPPIPELQIIRFNIVYTLHLVEEPVPENFSVRSLDLLSEYIFDEILELVDIDWKGQGATDEHCRRFHVMPRFSRPFPENGKELLSMNDLLLYLLKVSKPLVNKTDLPFLLSLDNTEWNKFVDSFRHVIVTWPGMRPSSLRIDQLDRTDCKKDTSGKTFPDIVHHGLRPAQLSYAGDPQYKKTFRAYMKFRHILHTRAKVTEKDKEKLEEFETELEKIRSKYSLKREVTVDIDSEGFILTGIRADICQHALLLPVLFNHIRFHNCLKVLQANIGYQFKDISLLQLAMTHSSYKINYGNNIDHGRNALSNCGARQIEFGDSTVHFQHTRKRGLNMLMRIMSRFGKKEEVKSDIPHNERLEYLGDAVVEFISSTHLYRMLQDASEGPLTIYRGCLVQNAHLAILADRLRLQDFMLYAHGTDLCHTSTLNHAMANCFEALMGALYLDGGIELPDRVFSDTLWKGEPELHEIWTNTPPHPLVAEEPDGDRHWIKQSPVLQFEEEMGYEFRHIRLLARALTMKSIGFNNLTLGNNQRMEYLGDTIMQLIVTDYLYRHFPDHHEGHLSLLRSSIVSNRTQSIVSDELGLSSYLVKQQNVKRTGVKPKDQPNYTLKMKERADLLEALLGAMFVDGGIAPCRVLCEVCFFPRLEKFILNQDWNDPKSHLQQCCLTLRNVEDETPDIPIYKVINQSGPSNLRRYKVAVYFREKRLAIGEGGSIQQAEMDAANKALESPDLADKNNMKIRYGRKGMKQPPGRQPWNSSWKQNQHTGQPFRNKGGQVQRQNRPRPGQPIKNKGGQVPHLGGQQPVPPLAGPSNQDDQISQPEGQQIVPPQA